MSGTARVITKAELSKAGCGVEGCTHDHDVVYLNSACHIGRAVEVRYDKRDELLIISCYMCDTEIVRIKI